MRHEVPPVAPDRGAAEQDLVAGFEVLGELGRGSAATVLHVRRSGDDASYALKILDRDESAPQQALTALCREAALLASVDHPGLVGIHEVGDHDGRPYLVMDLVDGRTLTQLLEQGPLAPERAIAVALDVVEPLAAVHRTGLVHRDIKPDNIMIRPDGRAQLIDFGLAARESADDAEVTVGTLMYAPPEQSGVLRRSVDNRSDLYALGVVLFECLAGRPPFSSPDVGELLRLHAVAPPPALPGTPSGLADVVSALLAKDPDDRYQHGEELAEDLHRLAGYPDVPFRSSRTTGRADRADRDAQHPMIGRAGELEHLASRWEAARRGAGGVCVIRGGAGTGKSRLVAELMSRADPDGAVVPVVLRAAAVADDPVPLAPLRRAIDGYLNGLPAAGRAEVHDRIRASAAEAAPLLAALAPSLAAVLGPVQTVEDDRQDLFTMAVAGFLTALARAGGGLLLAVDDVQWLDPGTSRVLVHLAGQLDSAPVLLVATTREDSAPDAPATAFLTTLAEAGAAELALTPLSAEDVAGLVQRLLPGIQADDSLLRLLIARGRGNPLVVREYLRAIVDAGLLRPSWGRWLLDEESLEALELPQDALGLLLNRVHDLDDGTRTPLITAALVGVAFPPDVVAAVHAVDVAEVLEILGGAAERGLVEQRAGGVFAFVHSGIRDALSASLDAPAAARRHRTIAEALESLPVPPTGLPVERTYAIAHHYVAGGVDVVVEQAFRACVAAGELALHSYAPAEAVRFLSHAMALADPPTAQLLLSLGTALKQTGQFTDAVLSLEQALQAQHDPLRRAEILVLLADVHRATWCLDDGLAVVTQGLAELRTRVPGNRFAAAVTTAVMLIAAVFMQWTGLGFAAARGDQRRRCALVAALHEMGSYLSALQQELGLVAVHTFRSLYWANRVGEGVQYAHAQSALGTVTNALGRPRTSARAYARMDADPSVAEPSEKALAAYRRANADYVASRDSGARQSQIMMDQGQWMDIGSYAEAVGGFIQDALAQGRNQEAARWWTLAQRRLAMSAGERTALYIVPPLLAAANGQHAEAVAHMRRIEAEQARLSGAGLVAARASAWIFVLSEQNESGAPFDDAVAAYEALRMPPAFLPRAYRVVLFHVAMGRIAQCRAADGADRAARLGAARTAVANIGKGARDAVSRSWQRIARADLLIVTGHAQEALRLLGADDTVHQPDAPLLTYEQARVRARAFQALGGHEAARRHAQFALTLAEELEWPHRAGWIVAEFAGTSRAGQHASSSALVSRTTTTRGTRSASHSTGSTSAVTRQVDRQRLHALQHLGAAASRILDPEELARIALDEMIQLLHADRAFLFLVTDRDDTLTPHLGRGADGTDVEITGYSASLVERVRVTREPLVITGTEEGAALGAQSVVLHGLRSIMIAPLVLDERLLGVVYLDSQVAKGIFTADDAGILLALAIHIATSLETARTAQLEISMQAAQRQRDLANQLREAFEAMSDTLEPDAVLDRLLRWTATLVPNRGVWLLAPHGDGYALLEPATDDAPQRHILADDPATLELFTLDRPTTGPDLPVPDALARRAPDTASWTMLPLRSRNNHLGVLAIASAAPDAALQQQIEVAAALVAQGITAYDNASLFARVQELATVDELTGIANRRRFFEVAGRDLAEANRHVRPVVAMMLDIDHFKQVNDTYGHPTGDDVIRTVAARFAREIRTTDVLCRYGGEEFAMLMPDADLPGGHVLAERMRACIADEPIQTRSGPLAVTVSIGLSAAEPGSDDVAVLLAEADQGLYRAKQAGRNRTCDHSEALAAIDLDHRVAPAV